jgi:hypothetical protein
VAEPEWDAAVVDIPMEAAPSQEKTKETKPSDNS